MFESIVIAWLCVLTFECVIIRRNMLKLITAIELLSKTTARIAGLSDKEIQQTLGEENER